MMRLQANTSSHCDTLIDLMRLRTEERPNALAYRFLTSGDAGDGAQEWTYGEMDLRARAIAARLQDARAEGERVLLLYPPGIEFIAAFLGCVHAGAVAVPAYPHRTLDRLRAIARDSQARFVLTTSDFLKISQTLRGQARELEEAQWIPTDLLTNDGSRKDSAPTSRFTSSDGCRSSTTWD
jgi:acyl-CoA synthetase (AMP-forming)/AMP-acid ligase II